jgi:RecB family exonuclease
MTLTFGLSLDGFKPLSTHFNQQHAGPAGLATALELRLGLATPAAGKARRVSQYLKASELCCEHEAPLFFEHSFQADPWGTATALLNLRDNLRMAGWDGTAPDEAPSRLRGLAALEEQAKGHLSPSLADRLAAILQALPDLPSKRRPKVICRDKKEHLPWLIQQVLVELDTTFEDERSGTTTGPNNLSRLQAFLSGKASSIASWDRDDPSVIFATTHSEITLAEFAAQRLRDAGSDTALLSPGPMALTSENIRGRQNPAPATRESSPFRPTLQLLRLTLEMRWDQPDPSLMLAFFRNPICPVGTGLRHQLAAAICQAPGIGSEAWAKAIKTQKEKLQTRDFESKKERGAALEKLENDLRRWIEVTRFNRLSGAPGDDLSETARQLSLWASNQAGLAKRLGISRQLQSLARTANELAGILSAIPLVNSNELAHILELVIGEGLAAGNHHHQLGCPQFFSDPGALVESHPTVIWHGFEDSGSGLERDWNNTETSYLKKQGVHLQEAGDLLACRLAQAGRPILAASQQVILLWPREKNLEPVAPHPLLTRIKTAHPNLPIFDLDQDELPGLPATAKTEVPERPLPTLSRWIRLPQGLPPLSLLKKESFSSLNQFIHRPIEWILDRQAKLHRTKQINVGTQRGNLLHGVVERLLDPACALKWQTMAKSEFRSWLKQIWKELLKTEGANYLLPGQEEGRSLREEAQLATWIFITQLKKAGVVEALAEVGNLPTVPLRPGCQVGGRIDLIARTQDGHTAVIDLKYGQKKNKMDDLKNNTALQLAIYSQLVNQDEGTWPAAAYFILRSRELLAPDSNFFKEATTPAPQDSLPDLETTWSEFLDVLAWREKQLADGWLEVPLKGAAPIHEDAERPSSDPPHANWKSNEDAPRYDPYHFLIGTEDQS